MWAQSIPVNSASETVILTYQRIRRQSELLCEPLAVEDYGLQAIAETSPPKWHLAHTTWFFETFVLKPFVRNYRPYHELYEYLFNSYYNGIGKPFARAHRGILSRPTCMEVFQYRAAIDERMALLLEQSGHAQRDSVLARTELGLQHEQQHQELLLTDIKYNFSLNPLQPLYRPAAAVETVRAPALGLAPKLRWQSYAGGLSRIGAAAGTAFRFDNEMPRHDVLLQPFALATRPVSNGDYLAFIEDGGYRRPELWLSDGWQALQQHGWTAPLYWSAEQRAGRVFTLHGPAPLEASAPVCHVSYYEAEAYARWARARLPTEAEWEHAAASEPVAGHFVNDGFLQPRAVAANTGMQQLYGDVWEWTASPYTAYPGYQIDAGALGEYNGKFMCNQLVLRGGSCASEREHLRPSYRNFFYPADRWQFSGIRLARTLSGNGG